MLNDAVDRRGGLDCIEYLQEAALSWRRWTECTKTERTVRSGERYCDPQEHVKMCTQTGLREGEEYGRND